MSPEFFDSLSRLMRLRGGSAQEAARLILVEGLRPSEAARRTGIFLDSASKAAVRVRKAARIVSGAVDGFLKGE